VTPITSARWDSLCAAEQSRISSGMTGEEVHSERTRHDRDTGGGTRLRLRPRPKPRLQAQAGGWRRPQARGRRRRRTTKVRSRRGAKEGET
jgi:hypothetical protein